jgi:hypothetical protein
MAFDRRASARLVEEGRRGQLEQAGSKNRFWPTHSSSAKPKAKWFRTSRARFIQNRFLTISPRWANTRSAARAALTVGTFTPHSLHSPRQHLPSVPNQSKFKINNRLVPRTQSFIHSVTHSFTPSVTNKLTLSLLAKHRQVQKLGVSPRSLLNQGLHPSRESFQIGPPAESKVW